jgi:hypothetical protein
LNLRLVSFIPPSQAYTLFRWTLRPRSLILLDSSNYEIKKNKNNSLNNNNSCNNNFKYCFNKLYYDFVKNIYILVLKFRLTWVFMCIYYQKKQIVFKFKLKKRKWLKFENWPLKYISELSSIIPISIQVLIPDLVFPVYKIE